MTGPDLIESQTRLAEEINQHFQISCTRQTIHRWRTKHNPPFPAPDSGGRYSRSKCFEWVQTYVVDPMKQDIGAANTQELLHKAVLAEAQRKIDRARREKALADDAEGLTIFKAEAHRNAVGALKAHHSFTKRALENNFPLNLKEKLILVGMTEEMAVVIYDWSVLEMRKVIDAIERDCKNA